MLQTTSVSCLSYALETGSKGLSPKLRDGLADHSPRSMIKAEAEGRGINHGARTVVQAHHAAEDLNTVLTRPLLRESTLIALNSLQEEPPIQFRALTHRNAITVYSVHCRTTSFSFILNGGQAFL